jgi:hypothetical protein
MTWQNKETAELVAAERQAVRPSQADRMRIRDALRVHLEPSASVVNEIPLRPKQASPPKGGRISWTKALLTGTGVAAVGLAVVFSVGRRDPAPINAAPSAQESMTSASLPGAAPSAAVDFEHPDVPSQTESVASDVVRAVPAPSLYTKGPSDTLAQEVALLARAEKDFHAGNFVRALSDVGEYKRRFPRGALTQERRHLRAQILCRLGRVREAEIEQLGTVGSAPSGAVCPPGTPSVSQ